MKYISNNDQELISESYNSIHINALLEEASAQHPDKTTNELIDLLVSEGYLAEGLGTQLKSRFAQGIGALKGLGGKIAGGSQKGFGDIASKAVGGIEKGLKAFAPTDASGNPISGGPSQASSWASNIQSAGQDKMDRSQIQGQLAKYQTAINTIVRDVSNDLAKLNMPVKNQDDFKKDLFRMLGKHLDLPQQATGPGGRKTSNRTFTGSSGATGTITPNY